MSGEMIQQAPAPKESRAAIWSERLAMLAVVVYSSWLILLPNLRHIGINIDFLYKHHGERHLIVHCVTIMLALGAVVTGVRAMRQIRASGGLLKGNDRADRAIFAGTVMLIALTGVTILAIVGPYLFHS